MVRPLRCLKKRDFLVFAICFFVMAISFFIFTILKPEWLEDDAPLITRRGTIIGYAPAGLVIPLGIAILLILAYTSLKKYKQAKE